MIDELYLELKDDEWPYTYIDHDRRTVRALVMDDDGKFLFVGANRDDEFGVSELIETAGGGMEPGEDEVTALHRELKEELGAEVEVIARIGVVKDCYNLIHRRTITAFYLCRALSFGERHLTRDEIDKFHLVTLKMTLDEAEKEYERLRWSPLGRLISNRELPVLRYVKENLLK